MEEIKNCGNCSNHDNVTFRCAKEGNCEKLTKCSTPTAWEVINRDTSTFMKNDKSGHIVMKEIKDGTRIKGNCGNCVSEDDCNSNSYEVRDWRYPKQSTEQLSKEEYKKELEEYNNFYGSFKDGIDHKDYYGTKLSGEEYTTLVQELSKPPEYNEELARLFEVLEDIESMYTHCGELKKFILNQKKELKETKAEIDKYRYKLELCEDGKLAEKFIRERLRHEKIENELYTVLLKRDEEIKILNRRFI